jgi:hypothetical protein
MRHVSGPIGNQAAPAGSRGEHPREGAPAPPDPPRAKPDPTPEPRAPSPAPATSRKRAAARSSMREGLAALFHDTRPPRVPYVEALVSGISAAGGPGLSANAQSGFLQRFLERTDRWTELAPSGIPPVDARLGGGFGPGLHVVAGGPGVGKTAFLESAAWEAVSSERPVLYYAFKEGALGAWRRLVSTLGYILDGPTVPLGNLRSGALTPGDVDTLRRLDLSLQTSVLPYLCLVEHRPVGVDTLGAFVEDVRSRAQTAQERHGRVPLLLVDDLDGLLPPARSQSQSRLLVSLGEALVADSIPGLLATTQSDRSPTRPERLPCKTMLTLASAPVAARGHWDHLSLDLQTSVLSGWKGKIPLVLDRRSGLFTHAPSC